MSTPHIKCSRCKRRLRNPDRAEGWSVVFEEGRPTGYICPDCQMLAENMEAATRAAGENAGAGDCVVCGHFTDTALWLAGSREYILGVIEELGVDSETAAAMAGEEVVYRVPLCADCAIMLNARYHGDLVVSRDDNVVIRPEPGSKWEDPREIGKLLEPYRD